MAIKRSYTKDKKQLNEGQALDLPLEIKEIIAPDQIAGYGQIYSKEDGELYFKDSSGVEKSLSDYIVSANTLNIDSFYNEFRVSASGEKILHFKNMVGKTLNINTWSSSLAINTARSKLAGAGTIVDSMCFGGNTGSVSNKTELFSGNVWSNSGNLGTARDGLAGVGIQTAAMCFGGNTGSVSAVTEVFNGSAWSGLNAMNIARKDLAGAGISYAAVCFGGNTGSVSDVTENFDGVNWNASGSLNTARDGLAGAGTQNAALGFGGHDGANYSGVCEKYTGYIWVSAVSLNTARTGVGGCGVQNAAVCFGGTDGSVSAVTEKYDGFVWSNSGNLNTARGSLGSSGVKNAAFSIGGDTGSVSAVTEKFFGELLFDIYIQAIQDLADNTSNEKTDILLNDTSFISFNCPALILTEVRPSYMGSLIENEDIIELYRTGDIVGGVWSNSGNLNTARTMIASAGSQKSALSICGYTNTRVNNLEKFNGATWTNVVTGLGTARNILGGAGTQNAALAFGGNTGYSSNLTEKYDGSTWGTTGSLNSARGYIGGCGVQNAAISFCGYTNDRTSVSEIFNGSIWAYTANTNENRSAPEGIGSVFATLCFGGWNGYAVGRTEKHNGSTWRSVTYMISGACDMVAGGNENAAIRASGWDASADWTVNCEKFNGSYWYVGSSMGTSRGEGSGCGTQNAVVGFGGGNNTGNLASTELFNGQFVLPYVGLNIAKISYI